MQALQGTRIIDLSRLLPGPMCTWYLQGLGATVVKVEEPGVGDYVRHLPPYAEDGIGAWYHALNGGKRSVALDLRQPAAVQALLALLGRADVLVESFRPGVMARLGLAPEALLERFPTLVIASISGFGQQGPGRDWPGHDLGYCSLAGLLSLSRRHDGLPDPPAIPLADMAGGALTAALGITAALLERSRTGRGQWLDISLTEGALALLNPMLAATAQSGDVPAPGREALTGGAPQYRIYRCADGHLVAMAALEPKFQQEFQRLVGSRVPMTDKALTALFATRPRDEWATLLQHACVTPVLDLREVLAHPLHQGRGSFVGAGSARRVCPPLSSQQEPLQAAPLGAHTGEELAAVDVDPGPFLL